MRYKWLKIIALVLIISICVVVFLFLRQRPDNNTDAVKEVRPQIGQIQNFFSTTGMVYPKNRLEIKPPVGGRVEKILVKEGDYVKAGQLLALMSSTERAALLDAARGQGEEVLKYWQQVYKAIQLFSPIDGEVIVATTQPGQIVTATDAVLVLSDQLIVRAQVDETDIGKVKLGQNCLVSLDAYADKKIKAKVEHIYYESQTINNVTIYKVDLVPEEIPEFFRSGMNATIEFIVFDKENILIIPLEALQKEDQKNFVLVKENSQADPQPRAVETGASDDKNIEILSGINAGDIIIVKNKKYVLPKSQKPGTNPFVPFGARRGGGSTRR